MVKHSEGMHKRIQRMTPSTPTSIKAVRNASVSADSPILFVPSMPGVEDMGAVKSYNCLLAVGVSTRTDFCFQIEKPMNVYINICIWGKTHLPQWLQMSRIVCDVQTNHIFGGTCIYDPSLFKVIVLTNLRANVASSWRELGSSSLPQYSKSL